MSDLSSLHNTRANTSTASVTMWLLQFQALENLVNFALEYAIRKEQETNLGVHINGAHQVLPYADDVNVIGDGIRTTERNADVLLNACKDIGLTVNTGKTTWK